MLYFAINGKSSAGTVFVLLFQLYPPLSSVHILVNNVGFIILVPR